MNFSGQDISSAVLPELRFTILEGKEDPPVRPGAKAGILHARREVPRQIMEIRRDLQNGNPEVRFLAFHDIASFGDRAVAAIPELVKALKDPSPGVRQKAQEALRRLGAPALPALLDLIHDEDPEVFWTAAHLIADSEGMIVPAMPRLMQLLEDEQPRVRGRAAQAIGRIGIAAREAVPRLRKTLSDSDPVVRRHADNALEKIEERK